MKAPLTPTDLKNLEQTIEETSGRLDELNCLLAKPDTYENGADIAALNREYNELKKVSRRTQPASGNKRPSNWKHWRNRFWQEKTPDEINGDEKSDNGEK